jgi:hypothetical protein
VKEAKHKGFKRVQFESDSQVLVKAIRTKRQDNSEFLSIIKDIILIMLCANFEVKFVRRQVNLVTHIFVGRLILGLISINLRLFFHVLNL